MRSLFAVFLIAPAFLYAQGNSLREGVYLHTDRPYYYPAETVWWKAYLFYRGITHSDSASRILHVELIDMNQKILQAKRYWIEGGTSFGQLQLPSTLPAGLYLVRAYTNWMLNFECRGCFQQYIPVLGWDKNARPSAEQYPDPSREIQLEVTADPEIVMARQRVSVSVHLFDQTGRPVSGNASVSITDASVVTAIGPQAGILRSPFSNEVDVAAFPHRIERGVTLCGKVRDLEGVAIQVPVTMFVGTIEKGYSFIPNPDGSFCLTDLVLPDSAQVGFQVADKKGRQIGHVYLDKPVYPEVVPPSDLPDFALVNADALQRIENTYQPERSTTVLEGVTIEGTNLRRSQDGLLAKLDDEPDYVLKGSDMRSTVAGTPFLTGLQGKIPGCRVVSGRDAVGFRRTRVYLKGTAALQREALILIDGAPYTDPSYGYYTGPEMNPDDIGKVEVYYTKQPIYGLLGSAGVVAIFTKSGEVGEQNFDLAMVKGIDRPAAFYSPDYSQPNPENRNRDFRTTVFWLPQLRVGESGKAGFSFYAADLDTRYHIDVQGMTSDGRPFAGGGVVDVKVVRD